MGITVPAATAGTAAGRLPPEGVIVAAAGTSVDAGRLPPVGVIVAAKPTPHSLSLKQVEWCAAERLATAPSTFP
jgi:hypothetical protein